MRSIWVRLFTSEKMTMTVIVINTIALIWLGFLDLESPWRPFSLTIEYLCVVYFILEIATKITVESRRRFFKTFWNRFDFWVVLFSTPVLLMPFLSIMDFRFITILRLSRLFRLFRLIRMIPNRNHLAAGILRACKASVGVFLGWFLLNLILALAATFLFREVEPELFGNPLRSFYSLFRVFTVEGWYEVPEQMAAGYDNPLWGGLVRGGFMVVMLVFGILGLSLANAVFVDEMVMDNNRLLEKKVDRLSREIRALQHMLAKTLSPEARLERDGSQHQDDQS